MSGASSAGSIPHTQNKFVLILYFNLAYETLNIVQRFEVRKRNWIFFWRKPYTLYLSIFHHSLPIYKKSGNLIEHFELKSFDKIHTIKEYINWFYKDRIIFFESREKLDLYIRINNY